MSVFWEGVLTGAVAMIVVFVICARLILVYMSNRGRQALEQLAADTLQQIKNKQ